MKKGLPHNLDQDRAERARREPHDQLVIDVEDLRRIANANASGRDAAPAAPPLPYSSFPDHYENAESQTIVIDNGSGTVRAGWGGQFQPEISFPSVVGKPGFEDQPMPLTHPIKRGAVVDFEGLETLWSSCFHTLENAEELEPLDDRNLLMTCRRTGLFSSLDDEREKMVQLAFEKFGFGACYVAVPAVLSMYTTGCLTGVVVDSGYRVTDIVPVYEGCCMPRVVSRLNLGGEDLTEFLAKMLADQISTLSPSEVPENVRKIKEQMCYVAGSFSTESKRSNTKTCRRPEQYTLPDGHLVTMDSQRFRCPEALFRPTLLGMESLGVAQATVLSVTRCDNYLQPELLHHIVLTGGNSLMKGFKERMWKDVVTMTKKDANCWLPNPPVLNVEDDATNAAWRGGSMLSSKSSFRALCISRREYDEEGAKAIRRKCF